MAQGNNNNQAIRTYTSQFKELIQAVFAVQSVFGDFFVGGLEALDGVSDSDTAFKIKTSDIPCVISHKPIGATGGTGYDTGANVAFGSGTGNSSRFGPRTEVKYTDQDVPYTWEYVFHEGIDRHTVNQNFDEAVADRLDLQAQEKVAMFNVQHGEFISEVAGKDITDYETITKDNVGDVFNKLEKYFANIHAVGRRVAKVTPDVHAAIVDTGLMTTGKGGDVSENDQTVDKFKSFEIEEVADDMFQEDEVIYAYIAGVAKCFTGIVTARAMESEDFDGTALQGAGKAGEFIPKDNKKAVAKVTLTPSGATGATGA